ncbi:MAG: alanine--tRNA ligase [bacterium]
MKGAEIRQAFLDYFSEKGHTILPSSSLVPAHDPTLLFTNAGMVQFKDVFTGQTTRPYSRAATCQKCVRAGGKHNDLENVGYTARHHTFFEMLGNFSFGDYFKRDAIRMAWEFLTARLGIPKDPLWVTVFHEDREAADIWSREIGIPAERIVAMGEKDNFWSMGDTGPCGPCSEIIIDQGPEFSCGRPDCRVGCECDRYLEIWNLVFMQFERHDDGTMSPLPKPSIDTGMGLERITTALQGGKSNYDSDLFTPIIRAIEGETDQRYGRHRAADISFRVIADHLRAIAFLIADGVLPSNEGRGYVLRRIIRRAARHGKLINIDRPFLHRLVSAVAEAMHGPYPELADNRTYISTITSQEEERFQYALDRGLSLLNEIIESSKKTKKKEIPGREIFRLYDTYGFPMDLTQEILAEQGLGFNQAEFEDAMAQQREQARRHWQGSGAKEVKEVYRDLATQLPRTLFSGYEATSDTGQILAVITGSEKVDQAGEGQEVEVILDRTPFYAERGGQVGDSGIMKGEGFFADVTDTYTMADLMVHRINVKRGPVGTGDQVYLEVNGDRRFAIAINHTATHLLHAALREILGDHVRQAGSLVAADRFRFDYTHFAPLTPEELERIEAHVNEQIRQNIPVSTQEMALQNALDSGAMALFGEKYQEQVRVVRISDISIELCGGTHSETTGQIGLFLILSETGIAAGVRRIEALTGRDAYEYVRRMRRDVATIAEMLKTPETETRGRIERILKQVRDQEREIRELKNQCALQEIGGILERAQEVDGIKVLAYNPTGPTMDMEALRSMADMLSDKLGSGIIALAVEVKGKAHILIKVSKDLTHAIKAPDLVKKVAVHVGGSGGGRPDMAQAGGSNPGGIPDALASVPEAIKGLLRINS